MRRRGAATDKGVFSVRTETDTNSPRVTRLAPSPTGALHLGNVRTFLLTWAIARQRGWQIVLRIEDFDTPRVKAGAAEQILGVLTWLGIDWDSWAEERADGETRVHDCLVQSADISPYMHAMARLAREGRAYRCELTRTQIESAASAPQEGAHEVPFPSSLRPADAGRAVHFDESMAAAPHAQESGDHGANWRLLVPEGDIQFHDQIAGEKRFDPAKIVGDFVLWTKRRQPSYQLAVVVDDHRQGVTDVIRGDDLVDSAARQLLLYRSLAYAPEPRYWHLPLVVGEDGRRLAKRHGDTRVDHYRAKGVSAEAIVGLVARWSGLTPMQHPARPMSAEEFKERLDVATIPRSPITFTSEDDRWLLSTTK